MDNLWHLSLDSVLESISSSEPVPGGGSASSISGLIGLSLILMSISVTSKSSIHPESSFLNEAEDLLKRNSIRLKQLSEDDMNAFNDYMAALRLPKVIRERDSGREQALIEATNQAINVPICAARLLSESLGTAKEIVPYIKKSVISDIFAGCELIKSAAVAILLNVDANLKSRLISDRAEAIKDTKNSILRDIESHFSHIADMANADGYSFSS